MAVIVNGKSVSYIQGQSAVAWISGSTTSTSGNLLMYVGTSGKVAADSGIWPAVGPKPPERECGGGSSTSIVFDGHNRFRNNRSSTSTVTMNTNQTGNIPVGTFIKYVYNGVTYRGIITALTSSLLTFAGPAIATGAGLLTASPTITPRSE